MDINETNVNSEALNPYGQLLADLAGPAEPSAEAVPETAPEVISDQPAESAPEMPTLNGAMASPEALTGTPAQEMPTAEEIIESIAKAAPNAAERATEPSNEPPAAEEEELPDFNSEEFLDKFYDNPAEAVQKAADAIANKKIREAVSSLERRLKPLLDESEEAQMKSEVKAVISDFISTTDGAQDMFSDIASYIKANNLDPRDRRSYDDGYKVSMINRLRNENEQLRQSQGRSLDDYLGDDSLLDQIAGNERVSKKAIENYLKTLQSGGKPVVIGGNGNTVPSAQPANKPQSIKEAAAMLRGQLGK